MLISQLRMPYLQASISEIFRFEPSLTVTIIFGRYLKKFRVLIFTTSGLVILLLQRFGLEVSEQKISLSGDRDAVINGETGATTTIGMIAKPGRIVELEERLTGWTDVWVGTGATACQISRAVTGLPVDHYFLNIMMKNSGELDGILENMRQTAAWNALATNTDPVAEMVSNTLLTRLP